MIYDRIENLERYVGVAPGLQHVVEFIKTHDLKAFAPGRVDIAEGVFANFQIATGRSLEEAVLESHDRMLDVQITLAADEVIGWSPRALLPEAEYHEAEDYTLYPAEVKPELFHTIRQGEFVIYLPQDGHAPNITTEKQHRKVVFKVELSLMSR